MIRVVVALADWTDGTNARPTNITTKARLVVRILGSC